MNEKKLELDKNAQKSVESKAKDGETMVFVLPPNLLQKLGIDLGHIKQPEECPIDMDVVMIDTFGINKQPETSTFNNIAKSQYTNVQNDEARTEKETSILETANLMKESVFLSPTFIPTAENSLPGELEIANFQLEMSNSTMKLSIDNHKTCKDFDEHVVTNGFNNTIDKITTNLQVETKSKAIMPEKYSSFDNEIFYESEDNMVTRGQQMNQLPFINKVGGNIITDIVENSKGISTDENPDEAYLSDYSNSNQGPIENTNTLIDIPIIHLNSGAQSKSNKEINILSEEILDPTQLKEMKCLHISQSNLIPVNIKTFLSSNKIFENSETAGMDKMVPENVDQTFQYILNDTPSDGSHQTYSETTPVYDIKENSDDIIMTRNVPLNSKSVDIDVQERYLDVVYDLITNKDVQVGSSSSNLNMSIMNQSDIRKSGGQSSDHCFGVCIDMVVTDIDKHLEDNVEVLDKFVNEINFNDGDEILHEMVSSERNTTNKSNVQKDTFTTPDKMLTLSNSETAFQSSQSDRVHSRVADCINKEEILTNMNQNFVTNYFKGLPNISKEIKMDGNIPVVNTQIVHETNKKVKNKGKADIFNGLKNTKPISVATYKCSDTETDSSLTSRLDNIQIIGASRKDSETCQTGNNNSLSHTIEHCKKIKLNGTISNNMDDKVEIIANYLSQCTHLYKRKLELRKLTNSKTKEVCTNQSNHNTLKLKPCVEGIEKPGGPEENEQNNKKPGVLKTYARSNKRKLSCTLPTVAPQVQAVINSSECLLESLNNICCSESIKSEEFCLCRDFGRLAYYDCDCLYEHIHFWDHQNIICKPEVVFSIYDENRRLYSENVDLFDENVMNSNELDCDESTKIGQTICWNTLDRNNIMHENLEISRGKISKDLITETKECITNVDNTTNQNKSMNMLVTKNTVQDKDSVKLTNSPKREENVSGAMFGVNNIEFDTVQPKDLPDPMKATTNKNIPLTFVTENIVRQPRNSTNESLVKLVATRDKEPHMHMTDLTIPDDTSMNEVITMLVAANSEQHQEDEQMKDVHSPVEVASNVSTIIFDDKNTEQGIDSLPLKYVIVSGSTYGSNTKMETEESKFDSQHSRVDTEEHSKPKAINNEMNKEVTDNKKISKVQSSDINVEMPKEIAEMGSMKRGKKRRKSSKKRQDEDEPPAKRTVKCGVCEQLLLEVEWENHIDKQHGFIAWKAGESMDFKNKELSKKLRQQLSSSGSLKCTFCDVEMKRVHKYLLHVQKCSKPVESSNISTAESANEVIIGSTLKCGVCEEAVIADHWIKHISEKHNYLAWKDGEPALNLNDEDAVRRYLRDIVKQFGALICSKCGLSRKYGKSYLEHVENCTGISENEDSLDNTTNYIEEKVASTSSEDIKCGVCNQDIGTSNWISHIAKEHNYLAWKDGDPPLDLNDEEQIRQHLSTISKLCGGLNCSKCGLNRKYVKKYLEHTKNCNFEKVSNDDSQIDVAGDMSHVPEFNTSLNTSVDDNSSKETYEKCELLVKCGVCQKQVDSKKWIKHIQKYHNYLAWRDGETLNIDDPEEVQSHLYLIIKEIKGLTCSKCGITRKYVKNFLSHIETCDKAPEYNEDVIIKKDSITCGVCLKEVSGAAWKLHRMEKHYNVAWAVGDEPININNPYVVERYLKEYKDFSNRLICKICGISRVSYMGFYAHVLVCGKTDEETEIYKSVCEICNKKYLCIYQNQHMAMHREQVYAKQRKLKELEQTANVKVEEVDSPSGRRKAAEKAKIVIQNYKINEGQYQHICSTCGFATECNIDLARHTCKKSLGGFSDSDESVKLEGEEDSESPESDVDSDISDDEAQAIRRRNTYYPARSGAVKRMPFTVESPSKYLSKSGDEFCKFHFSDECMFDEWRDCECEPVPDDQLPNYLPPLERSCKVTICDGPSKIHNRFEATKDRVSTIFVGASIECVSWSPPRFDVADCDNYLAVACHSGADSPRFAPDHLQRHAGLIQIWDYGHFGQLPKFVFGVAHDLGTVWGMGWCPSGARDPLPAAAAGGERGAGGAGDARRLGLLAVACSTGSAYIFSIPYPSTVTQSDNLFYKLKPVVELRLSMGAHRTPYQATSLSWTTQKGHSFVVVGYGDGTTAYFDLNTDSPLLKTKENNVTILYPYHDERSHNSCVTAVDVYPSSASCGGGGAGAVCSAAPSGAGAAARPDVRAVRLRSHLAASAAMFEPHWPSALLAGDDSLVSLVANELEWWGGGRRLGAVRSCCACAWCARVALSMPPVLRLARPHPAYIDRKKRTIGCLQMMEIGRKRKPLANDDLATKIEPLNYEDAVKKYGIELKLDKNYQVPPSQARDLFPERFPLADVPSMAFCPSARHHSKLAVATHAGLVFLITL